METIKTEISEALNTLNDPNIICRELPDSEAEEIFHASLKKFVPSGDRKWWWEDFQKYISASISSPFLKLPSLVPDPKELIWFIAGDDQLPFYPVYETNAESASKIIGECYGFEYYLIQKDFHWLICENHHNTVFAVGDEVEKILKKRKAQPEA